MAQEKKHQKTLDDVRQLVESTETPDLRRRNGRSATERICAMAGAVPAQVAAEASGRCCHIKSDSAEFADSRQC